MAGQVGAAVDVLLVALDGRDPGHELWLQRVLEDFEVEQTTSVDDVRRTLDTAPVGCVVVLGTPENVGDAVRAATDAARSTSVLAVVDSVDDATAVAAIGAGVDDLVPATYPEDATDDDSKTEDGSEDAEDDSEDATGEATRSGATRIARERIADAVDGQLGDDRERSLRTLNTVATELKAAETTAEAGQRTVEAAADVLDIEHCGVSLVDGNFLEVVAASEGLDAVDTMRMPVSEGVAGLTYREHRSFLVDELDEFEEAEPKGEFHSLISVPVGDYGVFQAVGDEPDAFDDVDLELVELLAGHLRSTLDRIEREARLREQNERLDEFASVVSHDLRNPLTLMQAELEMAEETCEPEAFERVRDAISRMDDLIDDLLTLARAGEGAASLERVDVATVITECWGAMSATNATIDVDDLPTVNADPSRLRQLLENLFRNALEHGGDDVTVTMGMLDDDEGFFVADDGPGIPVADYDRVFESGYTTAETGTGFGLRIVKDVASAHGWTVSVTESEAGGARFEIRT